METAPGGERPFQGGAQPVHEEPPETPGKGSSVLQVVVFGLVILVILAGLVWMLVPFGG